MRRPVFHVDDDHRAAAIQLRLLCNLLDGMLNARGLFGKKEDPELRACAAMALGRIGSEAAVATLRRAANEKEILVRNAVNRALRGGTA